MPGKGDGTFGTGQVIAIGPAKLYPDTLWKGDFNGDGKLDIIFQNGPILEIWTGNGDGTFTPFYQEAREVNFAVLAAGDINGDGLTDIVYRPTNSEDRVIGILMSIGAGTFTTQTYVVGVGPSSASIADLNGDGFPEVIVSNQYSEDVTILENQQNGVLRASGSWGASYLPGLDVAGLDGVLVGSFAAPGKTSILAGTALLPVSVR